MTAFQPIARLVSLGQRDRYTLFRAMVSDHARRCRRCMMLLSNPQGGWLSQACRLRLASLAARLPESRLEARAEEDWAGRPPEAAIIRGR